MLNKWGYAIKYLPVNVSTPTLITTICNRQRKDRLPLGAKRSRPVTVSMVISHDRINLYCFGQDRRCPLVYDRMTMDDTNYDSPVISSVPAEHPPVYFSLPLGDLYSSIDFSTRRLHDQRDDIPSDIQVGIFQVRGTQYNDGGFQIVDQMPEFDGRQRHTG